MNVPFLNLAAQHATLKDEVLSEVEKVLTHGHYILGPSVSAFEQEMAAFTDTAHGIGVNSGSDALTLALRCLGIGPGDEVITTPFTYIAPAEAIHQMGARIVFADIEPRTFNLNIDEAARRVSSKTKAIIPVHLFGQTVDMNLLLGLAREKGIHIVEDCAQAIGATYRGQAAGSMGTLGCFSFYPTKNLGANGDGGMIVTRDEDMAKRLRMLRVHGIERRYFHDLHGYNSRLDELQAAILRVKLKHLPQWNDRRRAIATRYADGLRGLPVELPCTPEGYEHVFHVFALLVPQRDKVQPFLADRGVSTIIYYPRPLHLQKVYADLGYGAGDFPIAEEIAEKILPLPMYPELTDDQVDYVIETFKQFPF